MPRGHVIAHGGGFGWDEAMVLVIPLVVLFVLQFAARRRRQREETEETAAAEGKGTGGASSPET